MTDENKIPITNIKNFLSAIGDATFDFLGNQIEKGKYVIIFKAGYVGAPAIVQVTRFTPTRLYGLDIISGEELYTNRNGNCLLITDSEVLKYKKQKLMEIKEMELFKKQQELKYKNNYFDNRNNENLFNNDLFNDNDDDLFDDSNNDGDLFDNDLFDDDLFDDDLSDF